MCMGVYGDSSVKGGRGVDLAEILHIIFFLLALPRLSPLFCPNLVGQLPPAPRPLPPASYAYVYVPIAMNWLINIMTCCIDLYVSVRGV